MRQGLYYISGTPESGAQPTGKPAGNKTLKVIGWTALILLTAKAFKVF